MTEWQEVAHRASQSGYFSVQVNNMRRLMWLHLKRNKVESHDVFHRTYPLDSADARAIMGAASGRTPK